MPSHNTFSIICNQTKGSEMQCMSLIFSSYILSLDGFHDIEFALPSAGFREYIDTFDGYSFKYSQNRIQVNLRRWRRHILQGPVCS